MPKKIIAIATPDPNSPAFDSPDDAADAVSKSFGSTPDQEQAALIFRRPDGKNVYSTTSVHAHDEFEMHAQVPKGYALSGIVHSHPTGDDTRQFFSPPDLAVAKQLKVPSYIRFNNDASIKKFEAGKTREQPYYPNGLAGGAAGIGSKGDPLDAPKQAQAPAPAAQNAPASAAPPQDQPAPLAAPPSGGLLSQAVEATP